MKKFLLPIVAMFLGSTAVVAQDANDPVFPESFDVTVSCPDLEVTQEIDEDTGKPMIMVTGATTEDNVTLTFDIPEGWDGLIGGELSFGGFKKAPATWPTIDEFREMMEGVELTQGNTIVFPADGMPHIGMYTLYVGDKVDDDHGFMVVVNVEKEGETAPEFPESFNYTVSTDALDVNAEFKEYSWGEYIYEVEITGECSDDEVTVTFEVPEGWDGFLCFTEEGEANPANAPKKAPESTEPVWVSVAMLESYMGCVKANSVTLPVIGDEVMANFYLYKGDVALYNMGVQVTMDASKKEGGEVVDPVFPTSFNITVDSENVEVSQEIDEDTGNPMIMVTGTTTEDNVTLTFDIPEGWDGLIGGELSFGGFKKAPATWPTIDEFREMMEGVELTQGNKIVFPADGMPHYGMYSLYVGDKVDDDHGFMVVVMVEKEGETAPEFPDSFDITLSDDNLDMTAEFVEEWGEYIYKVNITGECSDDEVTVSVAVPEGWDGFLCYTEEGEVDPANAPRKAPDASELQWLSVEMMIAWMDCEKGNSVILPVNGKEAYAMFYLYKGGMAVSNAGVDITMDVDKKTGVESVSVDNVAGARYYNLQGTEVANPKGGVYLKVVNGKATKVLVK